MINIPSLKVTMVKTEKIIPYIKNSKKHPAEQIEKISNSILEFGFRQPLIIRSLDNPELISGHGRLLAAKRLGMLEVPVLFASDLSDVQIKAFRIADNRVSESEWDEIFLKEEILSLKDDEFDTEMTGFTDDELSKIGKKTVSFEIKEKEYDENIKTDQTCPKCGYKW